MQPIVHGLEVKYEDQVNFVKLDIADRDTLDLRRQFAIHAVPNFFLVDGSGRVVKQWIGVTPDREIRASIDLALRFAPAAP